MTSNETVSTRVLTVPNAISFVRLGLIPFFIWAFLSHRDLAALGIAFVIGSSDFLDGYFARRLGQVSELGKLLDPVSDRVAIAAAMLAFAFRGTVPLILPVVILARDALVAIIFPILEKKGYPRIPVNFPGKAATNAIFWGIGAAILSIAAPGWRHAASVAATAFLSLGAVLYWVAGGLYVVEIRRMMRDRR